MQKLLEAVGLLAILLLVLRVSLWSRGRGFGLRGGLTGLNVLTGLLVGAVLGAVLGQALGETRLGAVGMVPGAEPESGPAPMGGYADLVGALRTLLPLIGAALGGIGGYLIFGTLWRHLFRHGPARARAWLARSQFALCVVALVLLVRRLLVG